MYTPGSLTLGSYGAVAEGCPVDYSIKADKVDFMFGQPGTNYFEFGFDAGALRDFVRLSLTVLEQMDLQTIGNGAPPSSQLAQAE